MVPLLEDENRIGDGFFCRTCKIHDVKLTVGPKVRDIGRARLAIRKNMRVEKVFAVKLLLIACLFFARYS